MKLFDITLNGPADGAEELFVKGGENTGGAIAPCGGTASFETYFNLLPHAKYREYCGLDSAELHLDAVGIYAVKFYHRKPNGEKVCLAEHPCSGRCALPLPFPEGGGYTFFEVTGNCTISGGSWQARPKNTRRVKIAVVICTYRREQYVAANLARIAGGIAQDGIWKERLHVYVVDNAGTLDENGICGLPEGGFFEIVKNRNLGGSGGFARGMYEADGDGTFTHILLMDDDVSFDFALLKRTWSLLSCLTEEHSDAAVGGAMLVMERPCVQHEFGGKFDGLIFRSVNGGLDMREAANLLRNERAPRPDYNAWWYCCMPASCVREYGLPMPFFIKGDDVEYGMRAAKEFILSSGIAVWHRSFAAKYTGTLEYYIKRNGAAVAALRTNSGAFKAAVRYAYFMFKSLTLKNYDCAELIFRAYRDFAAGPEFFLSADSADLNREISAHAQPFAPREEIEKIFGGKPELPVVKREKRHSLAACFLMFLENYLPAFMFSKKTGLTDAGAPRAYDCFMKKTVVHLDRESGRGLVLKLDAKRRRKLRRAAYRAFFGILFGYRRIKKSYRSGEREMCSRENWERMFFKEDE